MSENTRHFLSGVLTISIMLNVISGIALAMVNNVPPQPFEVEDQFDNEDSKKLKRRYR